jgi:hypothetical protein
MADPSINVANAGTDPSQFYVFPFYDRPATLVEQQIALMTQRATDATAQATTAVNQLAQFMPPAPGVAPDLRPDAITVGDLPTIAAPNPQLFGLIDSINEPAFEDFQSIVDAIGVDPPPTFDPSVVTINIPDAPAPIDTSGAPVRPTIVDPDLPPDPDVVLPAEAQSLPITIPDVPVINLPTFDTTLDPFDATVGNFLLDWNEPTYTPTNVNELSASIKLMLTGGYAMAPAVQDMLFSAAREREDITAHKAVDDAYEDFASRNFSMPPGMLVEQVNVARQNNQLQANSFSRDVLTKAAEWQIENLRTALAQGIALESALIDQFNQMANRSLDAAKFRVQVEIDKFNLRVAAFNANVSYVNAMVAVFQAKVQEELSKLEVYKSEIDAQQLIGQINEQSVRIYTSKVQALGVIVDMYKSKLEAVQVKADLEKSKIELYRADVQAYAERLNADKTRFDAYTSQVQGESAKAGILESESRAFAATVQAYESGNNVKISTVQARLRAIEVSVTKFTALLEAEKDRVQSELAAIQSQASAYSADVGRYSAQITFATQKNDLTIRAAEATVRNNMAYFDVVSKQYDSNQTRLIEAARLNVQAIQAAGTMASQLAAGAMSATHVQASLSGSGSANTSWSQSSSYSESHTFDDTQ